MANLAEAKKDMKPGENTTGIRRIVTGHDPDGKAIVIEDRICPNRFVMGDNPLFVDNEIWKIEESPTSNEGEMRDPASSFTFVPPAEGNVCRVLEIPPDSALNPNGGNEIKPLFHRTASTDYAYVMRGEIVAVMDGAEVSMHEGDIMIQRGTIHAWSNRSEKPCLMLFVLCGARPIPGLEIL